MNMFHEVDDLTSAIYETILLRDLGTAHHSLAVAKLCRQMARLLNLQNHDQYFVGGLLHDLGKIGMPDIILKGDQKLTGEQREQLKDHVLDGERLLKSFGYTGTVLEIARHHHERVDGSGYFGLGGEEIPLSAKIAAIADSYDAIYRNRKYAQTVSGKTEALNRLLQNPNQYDKHLLKRFCQMVLAENLEKLDSVHI